MQLIAHTQLWRKKQILLMKNQEIKPVDLRGLRVYPFEHYDALIDYVDARKGILVAINAEKIMNANDTTRAIINNNIGYCDGGGAAMACHQAGAPGAARIPGCELWLHIIDRFHDSRKFYLVGAKPEIIEETVEKLRKEFPGIEIVGYRDGYIRTEEEKNALKADILAKKPDVVFIAMGSPKQEILMNWIQQDHKAIYQGLGGSFDVYTGHQRRAPRWLQKINLEFLYRLIIRPKRLLRNTAQMRLALRLMNKYYKTDN